MSPVNWFYSYPAYERIQIVDLYKVTKTIIKFVPTGSNSDLSQEQPTKNECQCVWVHIPVVFSVTDLFIEACHTQHIKYDKTCNLSAD
jgi:hypothetical protein